ncbi:putative Zn finger-like uncharacterized protein [Litoreibacter ponti]|uniref:Putative Zn finger-like uncharacterized protein n=1 Tax=Litoreibacter ponti TaxID=1510457 RepID=A0A2T6BMQ1_9RHOB|nr:zinc-ribbon domain-containing protein [Litoreibacter ponti]PTX57341.1 putative Zn finger-like uncharacterized protein [Litoreibacter ponti]
MRLICPNCDAEYEVDDGMIPPEGRDVQCSNCTTTWFQPAVETEEEPAAEAPAEDSAPADDAPDADVSEESEDDADEAIAAAAVAAVGRTPRRPELDPAAKEIIEQEVARETAAREAERGGIETQPDLGLDDAESEERAAAARDRMARRRGLEPGGEETDQVAEDDAAMAAAPKRDESSGKRELFPDIEEINSTLSPEAAEAEAEAARRAAEGGGEVAVARSKFRLGFGLMLIVAVALLALYVYAPQLSQRIPALADSLRDYVGAIDGLRVWLDGAVQDLVARIGDGLEDSEG